jgi:hypothetical protein
MVKQIVDGYNIDIFTAIQDAENRSSDPAKSIDATLISDLLYLSSSPV